MVHDQYVDALLAGIQSIDDDIWDFRIRLSKDLPDQKRAITQRFLKGAINCKRMMTKSLEAHYEDNITTDFITQEIQRN